MTKNFREQQTGRGRIDREAGIIHDVKVMGLKSRNRREYLREAVTRAIPFYENVEVCIDHQFEGGNRSMRDRWGVLRNIRQLEEGDLIGDLHYVRSHRESDALLEWAERFPDKFGLSHDAFGDSTVKDGVEVVHDIAGIRSVDVVGKPATNKGLFESEGNGRMAKSQIKALLKANKQHKVALALLESMDDMTDPTVMEMDMEYAPELDAEGQVDAAFKAAVMAIMDNAELDTEGKMSAIRELLGAKDTATAAMTGGTPSGDGTVQESERIAVLEAKVKRYEEEAARDQLRAQCRRMLESFGAEVSDLRIDALVGMANDKARKALVESFGKKVVESTSKRPSASPPARMTEETEYPADHKSFVSRLR